MEIQLKEYLLQFSKQPFVYVPNPGNAGDALIAAGTYQVFDELKLKYECLKRDLMNYDDRVVMYGGGGNLGLMGNFSAKFLSRVHRGAKRVVILPHTIKSVTPLLSEFGSNVDVICREKTSYQYVKSVVNRANVYLADDVALSVNVSPLLKMRPGKADKARVLSGYIMSKMMLSQIQAPSASEVSNLLRAEALISQMKLMAKGCVLNALRTDAEKTDIPLPDDNVDVSEVLTMGLETRELAFISAHYFLSFLNGYSTINTNRLHVCIGGLLLGKKVNFYPNSYFKCRAVYEYSLIRSPLVSLHV